MYGYLRVSEEASDEEIDHQVELLESYAKMRGYEFRTVYYEYEPNRKTALVELTAELLRADAYHVVVPSRAHIARNRRLREIILERLMDDTGALVLEAGEMP
jgi:DNA invertase Pin-like site-specific DNA recombinase